MIPFSDRIKISNESRKEVQRYLRSITVFSEEVILKLVRKMKEIERRIEERKYGS